MQRHYHRDIVLKIIKLGDRVIWSNGKYNQRMQICSVVGTTTEKVSIAKLDGTITRVYPSALMVVEQQLRYNDSNNVGANA